MMKPGQWVFVTLAAGCGLLVLTGGLLLGGVGMQVEALQPQDRSLGGQQAPEAGLDGFSLPPLEQYAAITQRPLFNEDRLPLPDEIETTSIQTTGDEKKVALNVTVNGIIITPRVKVAMITDNTTKERLRLHENMPLEGEQGAWILQTIEPRKLVFEGGGDEPAEVELATYTKALRAGRPSPAARKKPSKTPSTAQQQPKKRPISAQASLVQERLRQAGVTPPRNEAERAAKAEEIRRRVAERRAQLREEAARRRAEKDNDS